MQQKFTKAKKNNGIAMAILIALIVLLTVVYAFISNGLTSGVVETTSMNAVKQSNNYISAKIQNNFAHLSALADQMAINSNNTNSENVKLFQSFADSYNFKYIALASTDGSTLYGERSLNIKEEKGFSFAKSLENYVSDIEESPLTKSKVVNFYLPIVKNGTMVNVIVAGKEADVFKEELAGCYVKGNGQLYLLDSKGNIMYNFGVRGWTQGANFIEKVRNVDGMSFNVFGDVSSDLLEHRASTRTFKTTQGATVNSVQSISANSRWTLASYQVDGKNGYNWRTTALTGLYVVAISILSIILWIALNANEQKKQQEIDRISTTDPLTGMGNLTKFYLDVDRIMASSVEKYSIFKLDIRDFRQINDTFGYSIGDQVLKIISKFLQSNYFGDETCARITADHFVVLAKTKHNQVEDAIETLKKNITNVAGQSVGQAIEFNAGLYRIINDEESVVSILDKCNVALKASKLSPISGIVRYNDSLVMHIVEERKIEQSMHVALREGEFQVYIQPKYKLSNAKFMGAEALIRWVSPSMGFLPPDKFIPIFEKNGFVEEIDFFVLETVMQKMCYFHSIGFEYFPISVNMSRITIGNTNYINRLRDLFVKYPLPAGVVELEITETIFGDENKKMLEILEKMRDLGAVIVMDDFGSGYSSLNLLKEVPFDVLKIDREFMNESETSEKTRVILKSMIDMAQKIKVQVVCEGVETKEQVDFLNEINCDVAQGFYFARPMPFPKFEQELEKYGTKLEDANV